jgi:hypothetical protein
MFARMLLVVGAVALATGTASAQSCDGPKCGHGGLKPSPTFDSKYIKQFCYPTIVPGSCYGHFPTKWTPWPCHPWPQGEFVAPAPAPKEMPGKLPEPMGK